MNVSSPHVLIMAGGTGGHVFPALAVARALTARGATVSWLGTSSGIESRLVPAEGLTLHTIDVGGLRGKHLTTLLAAPTSMARALWQARRVLKAVRPALVIGMGGFASGPGGLMARMTGTPLLIHEQNAAAGLTNRVLARLAQTVLQAFPDTFDAARRPRTVGNPVRADILALPAPAARWAERQGPIRLLVLGGSGGALAINERVPAALAGLDEARRPQVWHQAGRTLDAAEAAYAEHGVAGRVEAFIDDMAEAYGWADLVVCRSGALTVAELAAAGVGALLVPYPHAVDDHQRANGQYLVTAGAARLVDQGELSAERLARELAELMPDRAALLARAEAARAVAWRESTNDIVDACYQTLEVA
ncbi:undecaprenyldiphospho-muramoylpentapeptide beta-N-acetylglucosaminyltransferase [Salinisphaera sp. LB1]|uniref:undecaprenyldiphospho-muramoylpentapeptide beta-N-acetylglucosaminyltransferase n=1 Tax=Salinisphaera sp. LB1 TaxID=2183911 RepID=UPI000D7EA95E|nr:undecaprenyldiphospho-muramoylpentapeptide beta-N-acetylglucosaminyltransferase [Salinisphaera sp. LB1]AWN16525.1 UDP-N-acetylglucosamine--N-acetylmuramyl- (pentapeptide) pyrophosphoryl-undecaprenol N-acetylglucosamine transferase [Salinisphaera sp. LB1]